MGSGTKPRGTILIVDDDKLFRTSLAKLFTAAGYAALTAANCAEGLALAESANPACMLLDFHMPDGDGGMVCSAVRASAILRKTPVIIVSADPAEEINAYAVHHADGFILKGAQFDKILAVAEGVLRRVEMERGCFEKGDLSLNPEGCRVLRNGRPALSLRPEQFRLLSILLEASPAPVGEAEIFQRVLNSEHNPDKADAVYSLVYRLRRSLGPQLGLRIKSVSGTGWSYTQPRDRVSGPLK
jgi:two-component system KDP operon response regulator KdpE